MLESKYKWLVYQGSSVQKTFTRRILSVKHSDYWERLKCLRLYSLQQRREGYQVIYTWKILQGLVPNAGITLSKQDSRKNLLCKR